MRPLVFAALAGLAAGLIAIEAALPMPRGGGLPPTPFVVAWTAGSPCELRVEAQAPALTDPLTLHAYWMTPTGEVVYGLVQAKLEGDQVWLSVTWPTKPGQPWWSRLDWKGGPADGIWSGHAVACPQMSHASAILHVDDVGVKLVFNVGRNFGTGDTAKLRLKDPGGAESEKNLTVTVGQPIATYTTGTGDFAVGGQWQAEIRVDVNGGGKLHSDGTLIRVLDHFEAI